MRHRPIKGTLQIRSLVALTGATSDNGKEYYQGIKDALREANERPAAWPAGASRNRCTTTAT